jgi:hypothetical protein
MRKLLIVLASLAATLFAAAPALAHDEMVVMGVVKAVNETTLEITLKDGKTGKLTVDRNTRVDREGKRLALGDIKVGQSLKILGYGDSAADLVAIDLTILADGKGR